MENDKLQVNKRQNRSSFFEEKDSVENNQLEINPLLKRRLWEKRWPVFSHIFAAFQHVCAQDGDGRDFPL